MLVLITYDLKTTDKDYAPLYEAIKKCGIKWWHYLESVWIVKTELSPNDCFERIREKLTDDDRCFIVDITNQKRQGWLPTNGWVWIKNNDD